MGSLVRLSGGGGRIGLVLYDHREDAWGPVTRSTCRREPYLRIALPDGTVVDGKATAWTGDKVCAFWVADTQRHLVWMDAEHVTGIHRDQSIWTEINDDIAYYYPDEPIEEWD